MIHTPSPRITLGLDPGLARLGYGVVSHAGNTVSCITYGCIETRASSPITHRLEELYQKLSSLLRALRPHTAGLEKLFFAKNTKTAIDVSHARGVILLALAHGKIPIIEFTPLQVKQAVTGYGKAEKRQVQSMIRILLSLPSIPKPDDAADALAIALCASNSKPL